MKMRAKVYWIIVRLLVIAIGVTVWSPKAMALFGTDMPYGERITDGRFPAVVRVWFHGISGTQCSGVLITPNHVLTCAHCAPIRDGEIKDSAWHESNGGDPNDAADDEPRFSFVSYPDQGSHPTYYPSQYWVHPLYDHTEGDLALSDVMVLVLEDPIEDVEPAPVLGPTYREHLERGAWVRHVGFGPTEGEGAHQCKTTLLTRITDLVLEEDIIYTWGEASGGDSGSPVFQRRLDGDGQMREVVVGILMARGIKSQIITQGYRDWIQVIVSKLDPLLLPDDYDFDGLGNYVDLCLIKFDSGSEWTDSDHDGVGDACDICLDSYNPGQFDTDGDGICNGSDTCPFDGSTLLSLEEVNVVGYWYWTHNPVLLEVLGVQSDGRWLDEEYMTYVTVGSTTWDFHGLTPQATLPEGELSAQVYIEDGCGSISETHEIGFGVDDVPATVEITQPGDDWMIPQDSSFTVGVAVEDLLSGPSSVELWLDHPGSSVSSVRLCDFPGPWPAGTLNTSSCTVLADFLVGEHTLYAVVKDAANNESVDELSIICYELTDSDNDGISDNIDVDPAYSECFEHGAITGCIIDRGDQELTMTENGDIIILQADCSGGENPASITVPCNPEFDVEEIDACESFEVHCHSAVVRVLTGSVVVRLKGIVVTLDNGAEMTATVDTDEILRIENTGDQGLIAIEYGGQTQTLEPGQLFDLINVNVDVKPGSYPNSINLKSKGVVPVAVLTSDGFDATTVEPDTVVFAGAEPVKWRTRDVDDDGDEDLLFHFKTQELSLDQDSVEATLTGMTTDGFHIMATDSVNIVPKWGA